MSSLVVGMSPASWDLTLDNEKKLFFSTAISVSAGSSVYAKKIRGMVFEAAPYATQIRSFIPQMNSS